MTLQLTKTALAWCLGRGTLAIRGTKRRTWIEIRRDERERPYLSFQLFSLRRAAQGPSDDVRDTLTTGGFYDTERIRFTAEGMEAAYQLLYPRDKRVITSKVLDIVGIAGLAAIWLDQGKINANKRGVLRGKYSVEEMILLKDAFKQAGAPCGYAPIAGGSLVFNPKQAQALKALLTPYVHLSMRAKLMLRKPRTKPNGSQSSSEESGRLLRLER